MKGTCEERMYLVFTRMPCEIYRRRFRSLLWRLFDVFRALINSLWLLIYMSTLNRPHSVSICCRGFCNADNWSSIFQWSCRGFQRYPPPPPPHTHTVSPPAVAVSEKPTLSSGEGWRRKDRPGYGCSQSEVYVLKVCILKVKSVFSKRSPCS